MGNYLKSDPVVQEEYCLKKKFTRGRRPIKIAHIEPSALANVLINSTENQTENQAI